ncbi:MAG: GNAT family N-acetyltransferase [Anaerolineae bacterium]
MGVEVRELHDKGEIYTFLAQDRYYAAYAIGDLEPGLFELCTWHVSVQDGRKTALTLRFRGLRPPALFAMGSSEGLVPLLREESRPERVYLTGQPGHLSLFQEAFSLGPVGDMLRMVLEPGAFRPHDGRVIRLSRRHLPSLQRLYRGEGVFASYQLDSGIYYGVEVGGELVSVAGTHLVSPTYQIAAVGNIFTHPSHRGQGYATACTSAVVEELLSRSLDIVLNVARSNEVALRLYKRLGFREYCPFIEALGVRKHKGTLP